jgi:hypothetical protein
MVALRKREPTGGSTGGYCDPIRCVLATAWKGVRRFRGGKYLTMVTVINDVLHVTAVVPF